MIVMVSTANILNWRKYSALPWRWRRWCVVLTACDMMTVSVLLLFLLLVLRFLFCLMEIYLFTWMWIHGMYALSSAPWTDIFSVCTTFIVHHATTSSTLHIIWRACTVCAEVWKKNVEVKSNVFRFLTFLYVSHYVKKYTIDMDMDSPSECGPGRRRRAEKSQTRSTKANAFFLSNSIGLGLMMLHAHHSLQWGRAKPSEKSGLRKRNTQKMCSVWIALSEAKKPAGYLCTFEILSLTLVLAAAAAAADVAYATLRILH